MKRILVPTDFSSAAEKAARFALYTAEKAGGTVILYHLFEPVERFFIDNDQKRTLYNKQTEANLLKRLQRLKKKITGGSTQVPVSTVIGYSPLIDNILGFAEHNQIDLIVMGTQGARGLKKSILGSVSANVSEKSDVPVLLVPKDYEWKAPESIVFATDCRHSDKQALAPVLALSSLYNASILILHLHSAYENEEEKAKERNDFDTYAYYLQKDVKDTKLNFQLVQTSSIMETLENLHDAFPHDVLAMVRREKSFYEKYLLGSTTKNVAYITRKPLLIIPEEIEET